MFSGGTDSVSANMAIFYFKAFKFRFAAAGHYIPLAALLVRYLLETNIS